MKNRKTLLQLMLPYRALLGSSLVCHILSAIFTIISIPLVIPLFHFLFSTTPETAPRPESTLDVIGWLEYYFVSFIHAEGAQKALVMTCVFLALVFFLKNVFRYLATYFMVPVRSNIVNDLRSGLYDDYMRLNYGASEEHRKGDLLSRVTSDVQEVEFSILRFVQTLFKAPIIIIGSVFLMLSIHQGLTLFVFVLMLFTGVVIGSLSRTLKKNSVALQETLGQLNSAVDESLDGQWALRFFRVVGEWKQKFTGYNDHYKQVFDKVARRQELSSPLSEFLGVSVVIILLWYGAQLVFKQELSPEAFFAFIFAFYHVIEPLKSFSTAFYNIRKGSAAFDRIQSYTGVNPVIKGQKSNEFLFEESIEFDGVSFSYEDKLVLDQVSFKIKKGEKVAIVGDSGSGKSTLIALLLQVMTPDSGRILIDGRNLKGITATDQYQHTGVVMQTPFIFNGSIKENLLIGRRDISDDQISKAISTVGLKEFISEQAQGLATPVGDRGELISGGEKQRITIARALLEDPALLIFDEPTSALDPIAEDKVRVSMQNALSDRTAIIIAHKISTIKHADRIMFLSDGKIEESGTHQQLIEKEGLYNNYVDLQLKTHA